VVRREDRKNRIHDQVQFNFFQIITNIFHPFLSFYCTQFVHDTIKIIEAYLVLISDPKCFLIWLITKILFYQFLFQKKRATVSTKFVILYHSHNFTKLTILIICWFSCHHSPKGNKSNKIHYFFSKDHTLVLTHYNERYFIDTNISYTGDI